MSGSHRIGFVVLPQGHGKSYRHSVSSRLVEAESLVAVRSTRSLDSLRTQAKIDGDWSKFDTSWTRKVENSLPPGPWVVMVPARDVGLRAGWVYLGAACLSYEEWENNLLHRKGSTTSYRQVYEDALSIGADIYPTNSSLDRWIAIVLKEWI